MVPPGTKIPIHEKSKQRGSWDLHGEDGWYIGPGVIIVTVLEQLHLDILIQSNIFLL